MNVVPTWAADFLCSFPWSKARIESFMTAAIPGYTGVVEQADGLSTPPRNVSNVIPAS
jgi:hypothetical protein